MVVGGSTSAVSVKEIGVKFIGEAEDFLIKKSFYNNCISSF